MKKYTIILFALVLVSFACCKKEANRQYSYWVANNDSFSTNEVTVTKEKGLTGLSVNNISNSFSLTFYIGYSLPVAGYFFLNSPFLQDPGRVVLNFYYNGQFYIAANSNTTVLAASEINEKARYILPQGWFINYDNPNDSVLIRGVFNEP